MGVRGLLVYCADYKCAHWFKIDAGRWPDQVRLSAFGAQLADAAARISGRTLMKRLGPPCAQDRSDELRHAAVQTFKSIVAASVSLIGSRSPVATQARRLFAISVRL
jgi:hypothetical protein